MQPTIKQWLDRNPGWHRAGDIAIATGYTPKHSRDTLEWLVNERQAVRQGAPYTVAKYCAATPHGNGARI
jgi:hypothetical protein